MLFIMQLKAHKVMQQGRFFLSLFTCKFYDQLSPNFLRFVIVSVHWDTSPCENAGLGQLPNVSSGRFHKTLGLILSRVTHPNLVWVQCVLTSMDMEFTPVLVLRWILSKEEFGEIAGNILSNLLEIVMSDLPQYLVSTSQQTLHLSVYPTL